MTETETLPVGSRARMVNCYGGDAVEGVVVERMAYSLRLRPDQGRADVIGAMELCQPVPAVEKDNEN